MRAGKREDGILSVRAVSRRWSRSMSWHIGVDTMYVVFKLRCQPAGAPEGS